MQTGSVSANVCRTKLIPAYVVGSAYFIAASAALFLTQGLNGTATIWPASGIFVAALLLKPPSQSASIIVAVGIASLSANIWFGSPILTAASFTLANLIEGRLVSQLIIRKLGCVNMLEHRRWLATFFGATLFGSAVSGALAAVLSGNVSLMFLASWSMTVCLGIFIITPIIIALATEQSVNGAETIERSRWKLFFFTLGVGCVGFILLSYDATRFSYMLIIAVIAAAYIFGSRGAAITIGVITLIVSATNDFSQPASAVFGLNAEILYSQLFLLSLVCAAWPLSVLLSEKSGLTARFQQANYYLNLAESTANVGHWYLDADGATLTWSHEVYRIHGLDPVTDPLGDAPALSEKSSLGRYHPDDRDSVRSTLLNAMERREGFTYKARIIRPDGSIRHVCSVGQPDYDAAGGYQGLFGTFLDITEQTKLLQELQLARAEALQKAAIAQQLAETDELTGVANRRKVLAHLHAAAHLAQLRQEPITVAILDVDHFKSINDRYGHHVGDNVLKKIGQIATDQLRPCDLLGRLGGEEFLIVLPGVDEQNSYNVVERIRQSIAAQDMTVAKIPPVTVSAGIAILCAGGDIRETLRRADDALYAAKEAGRNLLRCAA